MTYFHGVTGMVPKSPDPPTRLSGFDSVCMGGSLS